jgi:hypothetical protein
MARLKEFELSVIKLNDNNVEVIPTVSDELISSYIAHLKRLEDLEKDRSLDYNNNETNSSTPKANPHKSYPSLAPLPVNNANYAYGMTQNPATGQYPQFQPHRPNMATLVEPV